MKLNIMMVMDLYLMDLYFVFLYTPPWYFPYSKHHTFPEVRPRQDGIPAPIREPTPNPKDSFNGTLGALGVFKSASKSKSCSHDSTSSLKSSFTSGIPSGPKRTMNKRTFCIWFCDPPSPLILDFLKQSVFFFRFI
jgi:hypothetical protein